MKIISEWTEVTVTAREKTGAPDRNSRRLSSKERLVPAVIKRFVVKRKGLDMSRVHARYARCAHEHDSDLIDIVLRMAGGEQTLVLPLADIERLAADARSHIEKDQETDRLLAEIEDLSRRILAESDNPG